MARTATKAKPKKIVTKAKPKQKAVAKPRVVGRGFRIGSTYDTARTGLKNQNHWANADSRGPNNANDTATRNTLCRRARYERDNDPHLCGLGKTLAHDLIGTGPRLELPFPDKQHFDSAQIVERLYARFCKDIDFPEKLRLLAEPRPFDGETFGQFVTNPASKNAITLDLKVIETEQVCTPSFSTQAAGGIDGIEFDNAGNPTHYHVLREHPGESYSWSQEYDRVPAEQMVHWFRPSRPGQARGVSEFASMLDIGGQTRRYAAAVLMAAEFHANITGVMKTNIPIDPNSDEPAVQTMEELPVTAGTLLSLPLDFDASAFKAEQPTGTYKEYVGEKRGEMARPVMAPFNVITGNSSGYNYSSGRLDHVPYHRVLWIERERLQAKVLDKFFLYWVREAQSRGLIPADLPPVDEWQINWQWDAFDSIDPVKDAEAWKSLLDLKVTTRTEICASRGLRFLEVIDQLAAEEEYMRSKGIDPATEPAVMPAQPAPSDAIDNEDDTTLERAGQRGGRFAYA